MKAATPHLVRIPNIKAISIHAAREGGDAKGFRLPVGNRISIHAAREGGDKTQAAAVQVALSFQSTPPVKAATQTIKSTS